VVLLELITYWLQLHFSGNPVQHKFAIPTLDQVIIWANLLTETQMFQIILVDECNKKLNSMNKAIGLHLKYFSAISPLAGYVEQLINGSAPRELTSNYTIELVVWNLNKNLIDRNLEKNRVNAKLQKTKKKEKWRRKTKSKPKQWVQEKICQTSQKNTRPN